MVYLLDILANLILFLYQFYFYEPESKDQFHSLTAEKALFPAELLSEVCELCFSSCVLHCSGTEIWSFPERGPGSQEKHWRIISSGVSAGDPSNEEAVLFQTVKKIRAHAEKNNHTDLTVIYDCPHDGVFHSAAVISCVWNQNDSSIDCLECLGYIGIMCVWLWEWVTLTHTHTPLSFLMFNVSHFLFPFSFCHPFISMTI